MANLGNITTPNPQNLPFDTNRDDKPLAKASKVRMDDPVPGSTDNDAESWRTRHEGRNDVAERQISSLQNRAADLHAPPPASGWADALSNNSEGGLAVRAGAWNLAQARAATYAVSLDQNLEGRTAVVRVRAGADPRQVRVQLQGDPGMIFNDLLTNFHLLGGSADAVWDYYWDDDELGDLSLIVLQVTGSAAHIGQSVYKGKFDGEFSSRVLAELASPQPDGHLDARVGVLEDKSSRIGFDEKGTTWAPVANTAVEGRHPYGQWAWIADGNDPDSYPGLDYESDFTATAGAGFAGGGSGLLWVLPNNINWSNVRLVVTSADGTVKNRIRAQDLRNAPASVTVDNLPSGAPQVTTRWTASSDTDAYAIANITATDTISLEVFGDAHEPKWNGEYRDQSIPPAALSPETNDFVNRYERAQSRIEVTDDPSPLTVFFGREETVLNARAPVASTSSEADLAHAIRIANDTGLHRRIRLNCTVGLYLQQIDSQRTSGAIESLTLHLEVAGKTGSGVTLFTQALTLANFLSQRDSAGLNTYSSTPDFTVAVDETIDTSQWDVEDTDRIQFRLHGGITNGHATVQARFTDFSLVHDVATSSERYLPVFPAPGSRDRRVLKFAGNDLGYHPAVSRGEVLASVRFANRSNANSFTWEASSSALGGAVSTSGQVLSFNGRVVAASGTQGIFVVVSRHTPIRIVSQVFIPWSAFRTGSGTYVTNAVVAITQGHFAGFWDDTRADSMLLAQLTLNVDTGVMGIQLAGGHADAASRLEITLAV